MLCVWYGGGAGAAGAGCVGLAMLLVLSCVCHASEFCPWYLRRMVPAQDMAAAHAL